MAKNTLLGDPVSGVHPVGPVVHTISGNVSSASPNVNMNGKPAARVGDTTAESCGCGGGTGQLVVGSGSVFINGRPAAYAMASIQPHGGTASLSGGGTTTVNIA